MKLPKLIHFPSNIILRYVKLALFLFMLSVLVGLGWFLYGKVYRPITQAAAVAYLKERVALVAIDKVKLEDVLQHTAQRSEALLVEWARLRNPFAEVPIEPPPPPSSSVENAAANSQTP